MAIAIADALEKAHRPGRDASRPEAGQHHADAGGAKLLDFGLAKLKQQAQASASGSAITARRHEHHGAGHDSRHDAVHGAGATRRARKPTPGRTSSRSARSSTRW